MTRQPRGATQTRQHPVQAAIESQISPFEGVHNLSAEFERDTEAMRLFGRTNKVVVGFICTLTDDSGNCLAQGRGLSMIGYQGEKYVNKAILYARNASLIDAAMRASKLTTIFEGDEENPEVGSTGGYRTPVESKPSDKQVNYLKSLMETLPSNEQNDLMSRLPQMNRYDVSQLINSLKTA
jgi:hypothetical protein